MKILKNNIVTFFCLLFLSVFGLTQQSQAQDNALWAGFTVAPRAITTFEGEPPFQVDVALYLGPSYFIKDLGISPFYSFGGNSAGVFLTYAFNEHIGSYLVLEHTLNTDFGVYGLGITTPLLDNYVQGFVEIGSSYGGDLNPQPALLTGVYLSFGKTIKEW